MGERGPKPKYLDVSCPNESCRKFGVSADGNVIARGTRKSSIGRTRRFLCKECGHAFTELTGTAYERIRHSKETFDIVAKSIANGTSVRTTADNVGCSTKTVVEWTKKAGKHASSVMQTLEHDLEPECVQFDETMYVLKKRN